MFNIWPLLLVPMAGVLPFCFRLPGLLSMKVWHREAKHSLSLVMFAITVRFVLKPSGLLICPIYPNRQTFKFSFAKDFLKQRTSSPYSADDLV